MRVVGMTKLPMEKRGAMSREKLLSVSSRVRCDANAHKVNRLLSRHVRNKLCSSAAVVDLSQQEKANNKDETRAILTRSRKLFDNETESIWREIAAKASEGGDEFALLRRKGRLKEQDHLIDFMISMHKTHTSLEVMEKVQTWITEHKKDKKHSKLKELVPQIGGFRGAELDLVRALKEYDGHSSLMERQFVPPNFAEIRHILNIAQIHATAPVLELATFDADGTLYEDGKHFTNKSKMIDLILGLLANNVNVAIITAAGYPSTTRFEERVAGLLEVFKDLKVPNEILGRFYIMGGECNYLLKINEEYRLEFIPRAEWVSCGMMWDEGEIETLLDNAESVLLQTAEKLNVPVRLTRKERAVGVSPITPTVYEVLEELALTAQVELEGMTGLPFCAFNGGADCFVDVGNKGLGLEALLSYIGCSSEKVLHFGDRFTATGNDAITKRRFSTIWVANPSETTWFIKRLLKDFDDRK